MAYSKKVVCVNYVDPNIPSQMALDPAPKAALFPVGVMGQRIATSDKAYRESILALNPNHRILTYQEQQQRHPISATGPGGGPGYDVLRGTPTGASQADNFLIAKELCIKNADGSLRQLSNAMYIYDSRVRMFRERWLESVYRIFKSWSDPLTGRTYYSGILLDNLSYFDASHPDPIVRAELNWWYQQMVLDLRREWSDILIVPNSTLQFAGANGEMVENRLTDWDKDLTQHPGQTAPFMDLGVWQTGSTVPTDAQIQAQMDIAAAKGAHFYWCQNYQTIAPKAFYQ